MRTLLDYFKIDRRSNIPFTEQLVVVLRHLIVAERLNFGTNLPTEEEVAKYLDINYDTVAAAYAKLKTESLVSYKPGQAPSVAYRELMDHAIQNQVDFEKALLTMGMNLKTNLLESKVVSMLPEMKKLGFDNKERYLFVSRLLSNGALPVAVIQTYFPLSIFPNIETKVSKEFPTTTELEKMYNVTFKSARRVIRAVNMPALIAKQLNEISETAGFHSTAAISDASGRLLSYRILWISPNYYFQTEQTDLTKINFF
jgi:DNA-binding GntR family transcriptional regulator